MNSNIESRVEELLDQVRGDVGVADMLCDRHPADQVAFTLIEPDLSSTDLTYGELKTRSEKMAAALADLGVQPGDRVATLMSKSAEFLTVVLGIWRLGAVHLPLFTAFAPSAIGARLAPSHTKIVIVDAGQRSKLNPSEDLPDDPERRVIVVGGEAGSELSLDQLLQAQEPGFPAARRDGRDDIIHIFTSGTVGMPKAVPVPVEALAAFQVYLEFGLDVRPDDVFWNVADPGWAYGLYYGIIAPMVAGRRNLLLHGTFKPETTWQILDAFNVTNLAGAPGIYRALRAAGAPEGERRPLRVISSAGEPLNPEIMTWAEQNLGQTIRDHYGQTEHGMCIINCWADGARDELKPGSMGREMPGWKAAVLTAGENDEIAPPNTTGRVALRVDSPLMWFRGYGYGDARTNDRFSEDGEWYYTGDAGLRDDDGYYFFSAREDDVITMSGYRIGPFEVESALVTHPSVAEAAAIGVPDPMRGEVLEAYIVLVDGAEPSDELAEELKQHVKTRYAAHAFPRVVHFVPGLPKTPSEKVRRVELRARRTAEIREG